MAIKTLISMEGGDEIKAVFLDLQRATEQFISKVNSVSSTGRNPFQDLEDSAGKTKPAMDSATEATRGFHEIMLVLNPVLRTAGVNLSGLYGFSRLTAAGIGGLAIAIGGAFVVALARLEDQAKTTRGELEDLFGSKSLGAEAFAGIEKSALSLGTTVAGIAPGFEALTKAWETFVTSTRQFKFVAPPPAGEFGLRIPAGMVGSLENLTKSYGNFIKLLRAGRLDETNAEKAAADFFTTLQKGGKVTAESLKALPAGTVTLLAEAMGRGKESAAQFINEVSLAPIPLDKLLELLDRFGPQSDQAFKDKAIRTYKDALQELLNAITNSFKSLTGVSFSELVISFLEKLKNSVKSTQDEIQLFMETWKTFKQLFPELPKIVGGTEQVPMPQPRPEEQLPKGWFKPPTPKQMLEVVDKIDQEITPQMESLGKKWNDQLFGKTLSDALAAAIESIKRNWEEIKNSGLIAPAGAAEFTGGPLLQQQQLTGQVQGIVAPFQEADNQIRTIWIDLVDYIANAFKDIDLSGLTTALVTPFQAALPGIRDALLQVENMILEIMREAAAAAGMIQQLNQGGRPNGGGGFSFREVATGGLIRGPGTGTSDSILAWLSNREFVHPAKAVEFYGLEFMEAIRTLRFPKNLFSLGGLARVPTGNALATGGMAANGRTLTIVLEGKRFGFSGASDVMDQFERVAVRAGIAQIGRPPGWVR